MDKLNRLTRNDEWVVGARYCRVNGRRNKLARSAASTEEVTFLGWERRKTRRGWVRLRQVDGTELTLARECWHGLFAPIDGSTNTAARPDVLVGQYFHSLHPDTGKVHWQGMILGSPVPGWYLLQLFEWLMGETTTRHLARIEDMASWLFYPDAQAMRFSYREGVARPGGKYRDR